MFSMENRYEYIVNRSDDFITLINRDYLYEIANDTYCANMGLERDQVLSKSVADVWGQETFDLKLKGYLDRCFTGEVVHYVERFKFGRELRYMHVSYYPYREGGRITHALVFSHDITTLGDIESRLINYEYRDPLTGLYNRRSLEIILEGEILKARRAGSERYLAVLFVGIENLSEINRTHGHSVGSVLLENTGQRIKESLRESDYVFRYEGHELVVMLSFLAHSLDVAKVAEKLVASVNTPYRHGEVDILLDCRIGASVFPSDGNDKETLVKNATLALSHAVKEEKRFVLFDARLHQQASDRLRMESELRRAVEQEQFVLFFQPIVDRTGKVEGAESLIRWRAGERGLLAPSEFLPLATETGIIQLIGRWAIFAAVRRIAEWTQKYPLYVTVNLTAREFESEELVGVIEKALAQEPGIDPTQLKLEITETECMQHPEEAIARIKAIRKLGVDILIDDFGTGQSSLSYLKILPVDVFKIDRSFAQGLAESPDELPFLSTIIDLVKSRNRRVIVEGVSSALQVQALRSTNCDGFQGFYFSPPVPAEQFSFLLERGGVLPL